MACVFISYRRDDTKGFAGALFRELKTRLGPNQVFMDFEDIPGGSDFPAEIESAVRRSDVVLVLIGPKWLDLRSAVGTRRLDDPSDIVRQEIALALQTGARVIPVLVDGIHLPSREQLPLDIQPLTTRNAVELSNHRWDDDIVKLMDHVREGLYAYSAVREEVPKISPDFLPIAPISGKVKTAVIIFGGLGVIVSIATAVVIMRQFSFAAMATHVEAEVTRLRERQDGGETMYSPEVRFLTPDGRAVTFASNSWSRPTFFAVGQKVPVLYDPKNPESASIDGFESWIKPMMYGFFAVIPLSIALAILISRYIRTKNVLRLLKTGMPIATTFRKVERNSYITINGQSPFIVTTEWRNPISKTVVCFRGGQLWEDPTDKARNRVITVVVDPNNFHRYVMDLSFLRDNPKPNPTKL